MQSKDARRFDNIAVLEAQEGSSPVPYKIPFPQPDYEEVLTHTVIARNEAPSFSDVANKCLFYQYVPPKVHKHQACNSRSEESVTVTACNLYSIAFTSRDHAISGSTRNLC